MRQVNIPCNMDSARVVSRTAQPGRRPLRLLAFVGAAGVASTFASYVIATPCFTAVAPPRSVGASLGSGGRPSKVAISARGGARGGEAQAAAKLALLDLLDDKELQKEVLRPEGKPMRGRIDESILQLERLTPTEEPAYSELLDGSWNVKYSGSYAPGLLSSPTRELALFLYGGGFSLGTALSSFIGGFWGQTIGLQMGKKTVTIRDGRDVEATAEIDIPGPMAGRETLRYTAELMPLSGRRLSEEVTSAELPKPLGTQSAPFEIRRGILVTYLDDEIMVVRDESGVPEVLERMLAGMPDGAQAPASGFDDAQPPLDY